MKQDQEPPSPHAFSQNPKVRSVMAGCGLRRSEVAALTFKHIQQRDGRWCIVDLVGKHGRVRTVPMPTWVKVAVDAWAGAAGINDRPVCRSVNLGGEVRETALSEKVVWQLIRPYAEGRRRTGNCAPRLSPLCRILDYAAVVADALESIR